MFLFDSAHGASSFQRRHPCACKKTTEPRRTKRRAAGLPAGRREPRLIPLYNSPAAAGYAAPVLDEDFTYIPADESVPRGADFAVRIQGDSMEPYIHDESVVYVNRDPLADGDVGIFCVDGAMLCKQYHRDALGMTYLFSLNRARADADVVLTSTGTRSLACFGRVMLPHRLAVPQL